MDMREMNRPAFRAMTLLPTRKRTQANRKHRAAMEILLCVLKDATDWSLSLLCFKSGASGSTLGSAFDKSCPSL